MLQSIAQWFKSKGGFAHVAAAVFTAAMLAYAAVPDFHALVLQVHQALPAWLQELVTTALALYAWYKTTNAKPGDSVPPTVPKAPLFLLVLLLLPFVSGCKKTTATTPAQVLAPGYSSPADQTLGTTLKGIHDYYTGLMSRIAADKRVLGPTENAALTSLSLAINTADTVYVAYHNGTATLQQAQAAVSNASAAQAKAQSQVKP